MHSLRNSIIAALCVQQSLAGPVRRYPNTTSSLVEAAHASSVNTQFPRPFTFPTTSPTETEARQQAQSTSVNTEFPRPFTFSTSATRPRQEAGTTNSDPDCQSMTASSNAGESSLPVITTANPSAAGSSSVQQATTHTRTRTRVHHGTGGRPHGGQHGDKPSRTTTTTIFTTVTPHSQASDSNAPSGSSAASSSAGGSSSIAAGSSEAAAQSSSSAVSQPQPSHAFLTSNVATWGTYTITYTPSSSAAASAAPTESSQTSSLLSSGNASSSTATTVPTESAPVAPTVTFSFNPPNTASSSSSASSSHSSASAPPPPPPPPTPSSPSGPAGITIVPINTDATTIFFTVTDPGATTTLPAVTVTAFPSRGHRHGPP